MEPDEPEWNEELERRSRLVQEPERCSNMALLYLSYLDLNPHMKKRDRAEQNEVYMKWIEETDPPVQKIGHGRVLFEIATYMHAVRPERKKEGGKRTGKETDISSS